MDVQNLLGLGFSVVRLLGLQSAARIRLDLALGFKIFTPRYPLVDPSNAELKLEDGVDSLGIE